MKYYTGHGLKSEFKDYKIDYWKPIEDNGIYTPINYNYYQNSIEIKRIVTYSGKELKSEWNDRVTFNILIDDNKIYSITHLKGIGWTKEHYPIYYTEVEEIDL